MQYCWKIDYTYDGQEDFAIFSSTYEMSSDDIVRFILGVRERKLLAVKEIWELDYDKENQLLPYTLKRQLA